ncbi:MAG: DUF4221 domain-containing protein [Cytophagales bacterium]|nr:MAG: DUF4221 domain-containing protein [Cytophagales bacterium]
MKKLAPLLFLPLIFGCGSRSSEKAESSNILENLTFTVDTVMVDSGKDILNLAWGLRLADVSSDRRSLFLFNEKDYSIAKIDLDKLKLEVISKFDKEGPNGIGQFITGIQALNNGGFFFKGFRANSIVNAKGELENKINLTSENIQGLSKELEVHASSDLLVGSDAKHFFSLPGDFMDGERDFLVATYLDQKGKILDIPAMDIIGRFKILWKDPEIQSAFLEQLSLQQFGGIVVIRSSATSEIYLYDVVSDSLNLVSYKHKLVPNRKDAQVRNEVSTQNEFQNEIGKLTTQVGFEKFLWDEQSQQFFRFGRSFLPIEGLNKKQKSDVYLFAYDKDFKLIGETQLKDLTSVPAYPFFKDGKLWSYVNVEDELGFAVMDFKF